MKSMTKIRQAIRTSTITIIAINIFSIVLSLFSIWSIYFSLNNIDQIAANDPVLADTIKKSATPLFFVQIIVGLIILIVISFLCFQNLKYLKQEKMVKKLPYYIGIGFYLFNIATSLFYMITAGQLSIFSLAIQIILISLYSFTLYKTSELEDNKKEETLNI
ncbi:hypothetical protein [Streptococcus zalophi]|uniref:Uncharacterized protein n=1 Tax=Streptococcus zalophi TaxID=640031 RepID=A0A934PAW9_9STRE|nr:hypothetical protein [Streptococcus zalophi]MBJ8350046.1 hypothetical protein [Streptococcus zalophi]MCR8967052.1 hypothetical protein [Streptococcus zalophi]